MDNLANRKIVRTYTYYSDSHPNKKIAIITIEETLLESTGHIEVLDTELAPLDMQLVAKHCNNLNGANICLNDRAMQPNRCFFEDYCKANGLNPYNINDRLKLSGGRNCDDDLYIITEEGVVNG